MDQCCASARTPEVRLMGEHPEPPCSVTQTSAKLLDGQLASVPLSIFGDIKLQLSDLRHRQEECFKQLMDQQSRLQSQLSAMNGSSEATQQRQEYLIAEFLEFSKCRPSGATTEFVSMDQRDISLIDTVSNAEKLGRDNQSHVVSMSMAQSDVDGALLVAPTMSRAGSRKSLGRRSAARTSLASRRKSRKPAEVLKFSTQQMEEEDMDTSVWARVTRIVNSEELEFVIAGLILINALLICCEAQYSGLDIGFNLKYPGRDVRANIIWVGAETTFTLTDWFFGCLFVFEMIVKQMCWGRKYFYDWDEESIQEIAQEMNGSTCSCWKCLWSIQGWNILDFICVIAFIFDKVSEFGSINPQILRMLRLFRLFRLVRLLRVLESLDHLYIMTTAISGLSRVLSWAIVFLTIMLLTCDLFLVQILHATYFNKVMASELNEDALKKHHMMYQYFGTCTRCLLSFFEITLGNWPPVVRLLSEEVSEWFTLIMLTHKLTIGFAVIGVITGVILQETFKVAQTDDVIMFRNKKLASTTLRNKMKKLFDALDEDSDGRLKESEFCAIGSYPEIECWLASLDIETDELKTLFSLIDVDKNGYITVDELLKRMPRIKGNARGIDMLAIRRILQKDMQWS